MLEAIDHGAQFHAIATDEAATARLAAALAALAGPGDSIGLFGPLGSGKTAFARGFIRALTGNASEEVPSPTFTLVQTYDASAATVYHFDLYRIEDPEEVWELGIEDAFADGISLIEWPERLGTLLPSDHVTVRFESVPGDDPGKRRVTVAGAGGWRRRLLPLAEASAGG